MQGGQAGYGSGQGAAVGAPPGETAKEREFRLMMEQQAREAEVQRRLAEEEARLKAEAERSDARRKAEQEAVEEARVEKERAESVEAGRRRIEAEEREAAMLGRQQETKETPKKTTSGLDFNVPSVEIGAIPILGLFTLFALMVVVSRVIEK